MTELTSHNQEFLLGKELRATILTTGAETQGRHDLIEGRTSPLHATALHMHTRYEERIWVLDGEMTVWAGSESVTLGQNGFYRIPMNVPHMLRTGPDGARALLISSPAGFAELVQRTGTPAGQACAETELDLELFMKVTTELGDVVLGPPGTTPADLER